MNKLQKTIITMIYGIGVIIVLILLGCMFSSPHIILNPDSMLPMELHELSSIWLALGFVPMIVITILFYKVHQISQNYHKIINSIIVYIPSVICLLCFIYWICIWLIGIITMIR